MKNNFKLGVFIFLFSACLFLPRLGAESMVPDLESEPEVSLDFQDVNLKDLLKVFSMQSGLNFIASEAVQERKITLYLDRVPLRKAMDKLFKANNLSYELDRKANIFIVKDWGKLQVETETRIFYLKYASVSSSALEREKTSSLDTTDTTFQGSTTSGSSTTTKNTKSISSTIPREGSGISRAVNELLSQDGSVIEDFRTNSLIVTDTPDHMQVIARVIASLDIPVPQVMLEVEMLDVNKNKIDRLGIKFTDVMTSSMFGAVITGAKVATGFPLAGSIISGHSFAPKTLTPGSVDFSATTWKLYFDFIKQQSDTKVLARPRILTLNNETAEIKITTQEAVGSVTSTFAQGAAQTSATSAERIETGVSLRVTPQINLEAGDITMFINPTVKDTAASTLSASYKDPEERSTKSVVRIKDGETVIVGGLIRNDRSETVTKLPILGDIPLIGGLFRHKYKDKDKERELLVFITPHIIKDSQIKLAKTKETMLPAREQDTAHAANRQLQISDSLNNFERKRY